MLWHVSALPSVLRQSNSPLSVYATFFIDIQSSFSFKYTIHIIATSLMPVDVNADYLAEYVFVRFLYCKLLLPLLTFSILWQEVPKWIHAQWWGNMLHCPVG